MTQPSPPFAEYATAPRPRHGIQLVGWVLFIGLAIMLFFLLRQQQTNAVDLSLSDFQESLSAGKLRLVNIGNDEISGEFNAPTSGSPSHFHVPLPEGMGKDWAFVRWVLDNRGATEVECNHSQDLLLQVLVPFIPWLLLFFFVWFFIFRQLRRPATPRPTPVIIVNPDQR